MNIELIKEIVIPALPTLVAILVLITFVWRERKKIELRKEEEINEIAKSIYRDLLYLREQWQLFGLEQKMGKNKKQKERIDLIKRIFERIRIKIFEKPEIWKRYFKNVSFKIKDNKIFLLLGEMEVCFAKDDIEFNDFILYAIYKLLLFWEEDKNNKNELKKIIKYFEENSKDMRIDALKGVI